MRNVTKNIFEHLWPMKEVLVTILMIALLAIITVFPKYKEPVG